MPDDAPREEIRKTLEELTGTSGDELTKLITALELAAVDESYDLIVGTSPVPSSMSDARALRLRRICHHAGRPLRPREIEVVFRVGNTMASSIDSRMRATYPLEVRDLRESMLHAMREGATVSTEKPEGGDERYRVSFDSRSARELAQQLLNTAKFTKGVSHPDAQTITFPLRFEDAGGKKVNALTSVLGLSEPKK
jgi:hypothetical protein